MLIVLLVIHYASILYPGYMYDAYGNYVKAFLIAGLPPMIFGILLTTIRFVRKSKIEDDEIDPNEPKLLSSLSEAHEKIGKYSTIISTAEHQLLQSNTINPNYTQ